MPMAKLDLFDHKTVATRVAQVVPPDQITAEPDPHGDKQPIVISFEIGDLENAANWSRVNLLLK